MTAGRGFVMVGDGARRYFAPCERARKALKVRQNKAFTNGQNWENNKTMSDCPIHAGLRVIDTTN